MFGEKGVNISISGHAAIELRRRNISLEDIERVLQEPQQIIPVRPNRQIHQSLIEMNGKQYLLRLIIDEGTPPILVTAYRTSKIQKYWKQP